PTDEDWAGVKMALILGRPISFKMDLYNPLYVARPVVEPELFASLRPVTYRGAFGRFDRDGDGVGVDRLEARKKEDAAIKDLEEALDESRTKLRSGAEKMPQAGKPLAFG